MSFSRSSLISEVVAVGIFEAFFFPAGASIDNRVELFVSYAGRQDLTQHDGIDKE